MAITYGVDVSKYQAHDKTGKSLVTWKELYEDGARFAIIRASIGAVADPTFKAHVDGAREAGLVVGAYHYLYWQIPVEKQADVFLKTIAGAGISRGFCDVEQQLAVDQPGASVTSVLVQRWLTYVWGGMKLIPAIYSRKNIWQTFGSKADWVKLHDYWGAWYGSTSQYELRISDDLVYRFERTMVPAPWKEWTLFQYSEKGAGYVEGGGPIDMDVFNGDVGKCLAWFGKEPAASDTEYPPDALAKLWAAHPELH
jgi:lysozyme